MASSNKNALDYLLPEIMFVLLVCYIIVAILYGLNFIGDKTALVMLGASLAVPVVIMELWKNLFIGY